MKLALVGDIGGTNARFALWRDEQLEAVQVLPTADFAGPEQAIVAYLQAQGLPLGSIGSVGLAGAGPRTLAAAGVLLPTSAGWHRQ